MISDLRAATLIELLQHPAIRCGDGNSFAEHQPHPEAATASPSQASGDIVTEWQSVLSPNGSADVLDWRLAWSGHTRDALTSLLNDLDTASPALRPNPKPSLGRLPILQDTIAAYFSGERETRAAVERLHCALPSAPPIAFDDLLKPVMLFGYRELRSTLARSKNHTSEYVSEAALAGLCRQLLRSVSEICEWVLFHEFQQRRPAGHNFLLKATGGPLRSDQRLLYRAFVAELGADGLHSLFDTYPVLARLIETSIANWLHASARLIRDLETDWQALAEFRRADPGPEDHVVRIDAGLGDRHHGGRTVAGIGFRNGGELIYKPRDLNLDLAVIRFFDWSNTVLGTHLRAPRVLALADHGWAERILPAPLPVDSDPSEFYFNAGQLLCVLYLLGSTDGHHDNLIAAGNQLVPIDLETLLCPDLMLANETERPAGYDTQATRIFDNVLSTGLLPRWDHDASNDFVSDHSGLATTQMGRQGQTNRAEMSWRAINSDEMHRGLVDITQATPLSEPFGPEQAVSALDHVDDIVAGFELTYTRVLAQRPVLADLAHGPLRVFRHQTTRIVLRTTGIYQSLLKQGLQPDRLRCGIKWGLTLEKLARAHCGGSDCPKMWSVVASEMEQLARGDIPYFSIDTSSAALALEGGAWQPDPALVDSGITALVQRLQRLDPAHMRQQSNLIRLAFAGRSYYGGKSPGPASGTGGTPDRITPLDTAELQVEADRIAASLEHYAMQLGGTVHWMGFHPLGKTRRVQLEAVDLGLYDGAAGIALFLAAHDHVSGADRYRLLWLRALAPLRRLSEAPRPAEEAAAADIGLAAGAGGIIYAISVLLRLTAARDRDWLCRIADHAAAQINSSSVAADRKLDLIGGSAGAILSLIALHKVTGQPGLIDQARLCGDHLLARLVPVLTGISVPADGKPLLTGLSHGASGLALALGRLGRATGNGAYFNLASALLRYERKLYDDAAGNWPDLRFEPAGFMSSWCHGAPGISLARLDLMWGAGIGETEALRIDLERALTATLAAGDNGLDHMCCGQLGLCDILWKAGHRLDRADFSDAARLKIAEVVDRRCRSGSYRLFPGASEFLSTGNDGIFNPGFFQGVAGIGYQLLRIKDRDRLPSVVHFE